MTLIVALLIVVIVLQMKVIKSMSKKPKKSVKERLSERRSKRNEEPYEVSEKDVQQVLDSIDLGALLGSYGIAVKPDDGEGESRG